MCFINNSAAVAGSPSAEQSSHATSADRPGSARFAAQGQGGSTVKSGTTYLKWIEWTGQ